MNIIAFSGKRGVGKTAAAKYLEHNYGFTRVSFAEDLRDLAKKVFPFNDLDLTDPKRKEAPYRKYDWTPRDFLIHLGEFARFHDQDYWVKRLLTKLKPEGRYVIDDVRFTNEAKTLLDAKHRLIRIDRYQHLNPYGKDLDIPSETQLDDFKDFTGRINEIQNMTMTGLTNVLDSYMRDFGLG